MRTANDLEKIESQIMNLPVSEQIHLIERIARRVRSVQTKSGIALSGEGFQVREGAALYNALFGAGKENIGPENTYPRIVKP